MSEVKKPDEVQEIVKILEAVGVLPAEYRPTLIERAVAYVQGLAAGVRLRPDGKPAA